jgi:hypothetical protein
LAGLVTTNPVTTSPDLGLWEVWGVAPPARVAHVGAPNCRLVGNDADTADANVEHESGDDVSGFMPGGVLTWGQSDCLVLLGWNARRRAYAGTLRGRVPL